MKKNKITFSLKILTIFIGFSWIISAFPIVSAQTQQTDITSALKDLGQMTPEQKNSILGSMGIPDTSDFSVAKIIAWIIFGGIGFIAFTYGKKQQSAKPFIIGLALMIYPYFTNNTFWLYTIGIGLSFLIYYLRD